MACRTFLRDSQKSKVYAAERAAFPLRGGADHITLESMDAVREYVARLMKSEWWGRTFPRIHVVKVHAKGRGMARGHHDAFESFIRLPDNTWGRSMPIILHELAHAVTPLWWAKEARAPHGREFCQNFLALVRHCIGVATEKRLREQFKEHKVKYRPKRVLTPQQLTVLRDRGRKLAATRKEKIIVDNNPLL